MESVTAGPFLLDQEQLSCLGESISDFIEIISDTAHLKDAKTEKYILSNFHEIRPLGLKSTTDIIGLTVADLTSSRLVWKHNFSSAFILWKNAQAERIRKLEYQAKERKCRINASGIFFSSKGFIHLENIIKQPVLSPKRKVLSILTVAQDISLRQGLPGLLKLYRDYYPEKQCIEQILRHLKIESYFYKPPTIRELEILFAMYQQTSRKSIARCMNISHNTIASHIQHLKDKLITPDYNKVIVQLRTMILGYTDGKDE